MYHDTEGQFPPGGMASAPNPKVPGSANFSIWGQDKGSWLVRTLPYLEQSNAFKQVPGLSPDDYADSMWEATGGFPWYSPPGTLANPVCPLKLPYGRCPSDSYRPDTGDYVSYMASNGPQAGIAPSRRHPYP